MAAKAAAVAAAINSYFYTTSYRYTMRKLSLAAIFFLASIASNYAQDDNNSSDTSGYEKKYLTLEEVNLVSSYYNQDGNNSAVTGGIGTEKLFDFSNSLDLRLTKQDRKERLHTITAEMGFDAYTSASSDMINPFAVSSPSYKDERYYPSINYTAFNPKTGYSLGGGLSFSKEYDYTSVGAGLNFSKLSKSENTEFGLKLGAFLDTWKVIYPLELRNASNRDQNSPRNSINLQLSLAQVISKRFQLAFVVEPSYQAGLLGTRFHRVYFADSTLQSENLPDTRWKLPIAVRANLFLGSNFMFRGFYRYYIDQWGMQAHTAMLETPVRISPYFTATPFVRYYNQTGVTYFAGYREHLPNETFFTSDYDLSTFNSLSYGLGIRIMPPNGIFKIKAWNTIEVRYEHYERSTGLSANIFTLGLKFKPNFAPVPAIKSLFNKI
jgi:hypothetical protein